MTDFKLGVYQVKLIQHKTLEGLQARVNGWLKGYDWNIQRVVAVTTGRSDAFWHATVLYSEKEEL